MNKINILENGGLILKYQNPSGPLHRYFRDGNDGYYYGTKSGNRYTAQRAAQWLIEHKVGNYDANSFANAFRKENLSQLNTQSNFGRGLVNTFTDFFTKSDVSPIFKILPGYGFYNFLKNTYVLPETEYQSLQSVPQQKVTVKKNITRVKIGNNYYQAEDTRTTPDGKTQYLIDGKWYNQIDTTKPKTNTSESVVPTNSNLTQTNEWETKYNDLNTKYEQVLKELLELKNPSKLETVTPPEAAKPEDTQQNNYDTLLAANTKAFNNGIDSAYWRKLFRKRFNESLINGDVYGINPNGTLVFDINGMNVLQMINSVGGLDDKKGLTRKGMRLLMKQQKSNNSDIFKAVNQKVFSKGPENMTTEEIDTLALGAMPFNGTRMIGSNLPIGPIYLDTDEPEILG